MDKLLFHLMPQPVNMELGQTVLWYLNLFFVLTDGTCRRSGMDASHKALGCILTLGKTSAPICLFFFTERYWRLPNLGMQKNRFTLERSFFSQEGKKINKYINKIIQAFHTPDLKININTWNFAMTICFVEHQRETRPRLWNLPPPPTTATVLMIQKRCSSTVHYKIRHSSAIRVTDKTPHNNTYYSISSCMGGMLFCNTRTVMWLAATSTAEISAADVSGQKEECVG